MSSHENDTERARDSRDITDSPDTISIESTPEASTPALETTDMSDNEIRRDDESLEFRDPTAEPTADPTGTTGATGLSSQLGWPELSASTSPASPAASSVTSGVAAESTSPIPTTVTREVPTARPPFRVEPATPVPDDVVTEPDPVAGSGLPHLPSPAPAPVASTLQEPSRPALVVVRRGPRPGAIMLGLLSMLVAGYVLVANLTNTDVNLRLIGPPMIGAFGGMLLIVGLIGVVSGRMRR